MDNGFVWASWAGCIATAISLACIFAFRRSWFLRPSLLVVAWHHVLVQWSGAIFSEEIYEYLREPWDFFLVAHLIPLLILGYVALLGSPRIDSVWGRLHQPVPDPEVRFPAAFWILFGILVVITGIYLRAVPFDQSGLYTMLTLPDAHLQARDEGLKLLSDSFVKYSYSIIRNVISPFLVSAMAWYAMHLVTRKSQRRGRGFKLVLLLVGFLAVLGTVSLTGSRAEPASLFMCAAIVFAILRKKEVRPFTTLLAAAGLLLLLSLHTTIREGEEVTADRVMISFNGILERLFEAPMRTGLWHVDYAQSNGLVGVRGIRPLAWLADEEFIDLPNAIGVTYVQSRISTISAGTGYIFDLYSCFGLFTLILSPMLAAALDLCLPFLARAGHMAAPLFAVTVLKAMNFADGAYLVGLVTHGFLLIPVIALLCMKWQRPMVAPVLPLPEPPAPIPPAVQTNPQ